MDSAPTEGQAALPESGQLSEWPLPRILIAMHQQRFAGRLVLGSGRHEKRFTFEKGAPVLAESSLPSEALGSQLVDKGVLSREDYERVCQHVQMKGCREGVALLALELIGPKELFLALKDQVRRRVIDCFGWPDGAFRIEPGEARGEDAEAFRSDPLAIVQEGLETHWRIEQMLEPLAKQLESYPVRRKKFVGALRRLQLDAEHAATLAELDGKQPLGVALGPLFGTPRAIAGVWVLDALGCLEYRDAPVQDGAGGSRFESEMEIAVEDGGQSQPATASPSPTARPKASAAASSADGEGATLRAEIEKLGSTMHELDHYAVLGVPNDARSGAIKKAYFKAAKQYHPDTLARLGLEDIRTQASDVFARIATAFEVLSDVARRKDYDAELRGELTEKDAARLAQAETSYRKGEILLRMGDFAGSLEYLEPAVDLWPDEPVYQSALGWALFKQPQSDPAKARAHLLQAVRMGPEDATAHMRLGMVLKALGESAEAEKVIAIAKRLNPEAV